MRKLLFPLLILIILSACSNSPVEETVTIDAQKATYYASLVPLPPTPTVTSTTTPWLTPTITPTPGPTERLAYSPDGQWVAKLIEYSDSTEGVPYIEVSTTAGEVIWKILFMFDYTPMIDPHTSLFIHRWSHDSRYLFYYYYWGACGAPIHIVDNLEALDVNTGEIILILDHINKGKFALSHDDTKIAWISKDEGNLWIRTRVIETDVEQNAIIPVETSDDVYEDAQVGFIYWSPWVDELVYLIYYQYEHSILFHLDRETMEQTILPKGNYTPTEIIEWTEDGWITLTNWNKKHISINIYTKEVIELPTQTPSP